LLGWLLVLLASRGYLAAALLLPLYYLADATVTLMRRLIKGDPVTQAHRGHFYQRALDGGFSVYRIVVRVFALNVVLGTLASLTVLNRSLTLDVMAFAAGSILVAVLLWEFNCADSRRQKAV
jgi:UDP-N-acetylmuramyl pentapeptide phosphotransferase/UDP-N-acetylglucosamine-1-phosphate transferase